MKSPITNKEMNLIKEKKTLVFRKEKFEYTHHSYFCEDSNESFTDTNLDTLNIIQVYNQYLDKYNLPFPEEIISIRKKYDLPANKMGLVLGFGVNTYRNYENGEVPSLANAKLIQLAKSPVSFKILVQESEGVFTEKDKVELLKHIDSLIIIEKKNHFIADFKTFVLGESNPDIYTGYKTPSFEKLTEMIVFFTERLAPMKTVMNKLLFYSDFLYFKNNSFSISGTRYVAIDYGPVPNNFNTIFETVQRNNDAELKGIDFGNGYYGEQFVSATNRVFNPEIFSQDEINALETVLARFKDLNRNEIVDLSHDEDAWIENFNAGKRMIEYSYSFGLKHI